MVCPSRRALVVLPALLAACANTLSPSGPAPDASLDRADAAVALSDAGMPDVAARADASPAREDASPAREDVALPEDRPRVIADVPAPSSDAAAPTPCADVRLMAAGAPVSHAAITSVAGGYVVAWVLASTGGAVVRGYDEALVPNTPEVPLAPPAGGAPPDGLTLAFTGDTGVVAAGSALHVLTRNAGMIQRTSTLDLAPRVLRTAWVRGPSDLRAITADTAMVYSNGARLTVNAPNDPRVDPLGAGASVVPDDSGYAALDDDGGRVRLRSFITGHGVVLQVRDEAGDGPSASRVLSTPGGLVRLRSDGAREVDVTLETRDPETLALRALPTTLHAAAAWNRATGALALADGALVMAWSAKTPSSGYNQAVQVQWGVDGRRGELFRTEVERDVRVFAATVDAGASRAWVLFGERDPAGAHLLRARCFTR
ncbi:MAG: hypothetical protein U0325_22945 [Polyangiales bacterium]